MSGEMFMELGIGTRLRRLLEAMTSDADKLYEEAGFNFKVSYFYPIYALAERGPMPIADIAKLAGFSHSAVSQVVKKLIGEGYLETNRAADARQKTVSLSADGKKLVKDIGPLWKAFEKAVKDVADESGIDVLAGIAALEQGFTEKSLYQRAKDNLAASMPAAPAFTIESFDVAHRQAFYDLNIWWLKEYFVVEPIDEKVLSNPEELILDKGGEIYFAVIDGKAVGAVAMKVEADGVFELTKLAVDPTVQQGGMGRALCEKVIERFKARGGRKLYLETNTVLEPAIKLYWKLGFIALEPEEPSPYERANYYMEWQPAAQEAAE